MGHVVLLGDSIFDNAAYTLGGSPVIDHLKRRLPSGWRSTLLAEDGSVTVEVASQLKHLPADATHLVVSAGGNDVIRQSGVLDEPANSVADALDHLARLRREFEHDYINMVRALLGHAKSTVLSTIYYPRFPDPELQRRGVAILSIYNDCIIRSAIEAGVPLLDLRLICNEPGDYANPIEPSVSGGSKIAGAIVRAVTHTDFAEKKTVVFV